MPENEKAGQALRPASGGFAMIDVGAEAKRLKSKLDASGGDREATSLVKDYGLNVMLMLLRRGARLHEHHTKGPLTVQVLSGRVKFAAAGVPHEIASGTIFALDREVAHSVEALEDSALLLTTAIG
jgi:quercetin dioxygenase-like cupin family protein